MAEPAQKTPTTFEEFLAFEDAAEGRHEFAAGVIYAMTGGTVRHGGLLGNLYFLVRGALRGRRCATYVSDVMVRTPADEAFYPDVVVTCSEQEGDPRLLRHPTLIAEVLSESTGAYDRGLKFEKYRTLESLQEYVLVEPDRAAVDVYRRGPGATWTLHPFRVGDEVSLASLEVSFPIDELYADLEPPA